MNTPYSSVRVPWWAIMAVAVTACGYAVAEQVRPDPDRVRGELMARFEGFEGPAREIPIERWDTYFLDSPFVVNIQDGSVDMGWGGFHRRVLDFLASPTSVGVSFAFDLLEVRPIGSRLAWVEGEMMTRTPRGSTTQAFLELLLKLDDRWRAVFSYVEAGTASRAGCSCRPCEGCSRRARP